MTSSSALIAICVVTASIRGVLLLAVGGVPRLLRPFTSDHSAVVVRFRRSRRPRFLCVAASKYFGRDDHAAPGVELRNRTAKTNAHHVVCVLTVLDMGGGGAGAQCQQRRVCGRTQLVTALCEANCHHGTYTTPPLVPCAGIEPATSPL